MNHLLMKKRAFMAIANQIKGIKATKTGTFPVTLPGCVDNDCTVGYKIYGNTDGVGDLSDGKYNIPIVTRGKNVFDITKSTDYKSEHGGMYFSASRPRGGHNQGKVSAVTNMEAGKTYVITADTTSSSGNFVYLNGSAKVWRWGQAYTPTEKDIAGNIYFYKATNDTDPDVSQEVIITNVQIEEAAAATEYEPYHAPVTTTISLPAPLSAGEYISYTAQAIIHADDTKTSVSLPKIPTYKGTTILECNTENAPASAEITYYTNEEE